VSHDASRSAAAAAAQGVEGAAALNIRAARAFVDNLAASGVRDVCLAPGSRSAPLAFAFDAHPAVRVRVVTDERDAAFFALGIARASGAPTAVLCTSGTAAANFLPAVVEASLSNVPLIVLTADRPPELRDTGAPQTIRQPGLYAQYVRWGVDAAAPSGGMPIDAYFATLACRAAAVAVRDSGPVHVNVPFREPLWSNDALALLETGIARTTTARVGFTGARRSPSASDLSELVRRLSARERGLVVCGPGTGVAGDLDAYAGLAHALGWPLLVDALSGLRYGAAAVSQAHDVLVDGYDVLLRDEAFRASYRPDAVLRFGGLPTSKALIRFLADEGPGLQIAVTSNGSYADPDFVVSDVIEGDCADVAAGLLRALDDATPGDSGWLRAWVDASRTATSALRSHAETIREPFEGAIARAVADALPDGAQLFVGNSLPVRALDTFAGAGERAIRVLASRGANGIDGVTATALGVAVAGEGPTGLLTGDLSFLHDIGALQIAARHGIRMTIVVIDNDGGGIFSFLERPADEAAFERLFATPHGLDVRAAVETCGGRFVNVDTCCELSRALGGMIAGAGLGVVRICTDRERTVRAHRECLEAGLAASIRRAGQAA
jgi:2-succinyl-5-enolpyruvyl-6-hydroxy-3-cyclohexene-1-carboxylate synthase